TTTFATNIIKVLTGVTFEPQGDVVAQKLSLNGTYKGASETLTLSGSGTSSTCTAANQMPLCIGGSGTFTPTYDTLNYTATSATSIFGTTYYNIGVGTTADSNAVTYTIAANATVSNVVTIGNSSSTNNDTLNGGTTTLTLAGY